MGSDGASGDGEPLRVRPTWASPHPAQSQVLVRQERPARRWWQSPAYEMAYYPEGLTTAPLWVRSVTSLRPPGRSHPTDLHDLQTLVGEAWAEGEGRWTAWPVHHPAAARAADIRRLTSAERRLLEDHRARQRIDAKAAGIVPIRVRHLRRGDRVVDGPVHELTGPGRTRCGLVEPDLVDLETTFHHGDPQACPGCRAATGD